MISYFSNPNEGRSSKLFLTIMLLTAGREMVSKTSAYNITKLSYRVEVRVPRFILGPLLRRGCRRHQPAMLPKLFVRRSYFSIVHEFYGLVPI